MLDHFLIQPNSGTTKFHILASMSHHHHFLIAHNHELKLPILVKKYKLLSSCAFKGGELKRLKELLGVNDDKL
jgi:hypothetical protein